MDTICFLGNLVIGNSFAFYFLLAWSLAWKAIALWHAARRGHKMWFGAFLVVNTIGILEIVYLFFIIKVLGAKKQALPAVRAGSEPKA
jgi:hypothetical protein